MVVYLSMAFGNPYGDPWSETKIVDALCEISTRGIRTISLADTIGIADADLIHRVVSVAKIESRPDGLCEIGVHLHTTRPAAVKKILAAYDAGCRRFDSAIGGLGGCPFAQDTLVGNMPTESVLEALGERGIDLSIRNAIKPVMAISAEIGVEFA